jgi:hypothetical protein
LGISHVPIGVDKLDSGGNSGGDDAGDGAEDMVAGGRSDDADSCKSGSGAGPMRALVAWAALAPQSAAASAGGDGGDGAPAVAAATAPGEASLELTLVRTRYFVADRCVWGVRARSEGERKSEVKEREKERRIKRKN